MTRQRTWSQLASDRSAITAVEYGIVAAFFCVGLLAIISNFGSSLTSMFQRVNTGL